MGGGASHPHHSHTPVPPPISHNSNVHRHNGGAFLPAPTLPSADTLRVQSSRVRIFCYACRIRSEQRSDAPMQCPQCQSDFVEVTPIVQLPTASSSDEDWLRMLTMIDLAMLAGPPQRWGSEPAIARRAQEQKERELLARKTATIEKLSVVKVEQSDLDDEGECAICAEEWVLDEELLLLPCRHKFHAGCIKSWLLRMCRCPLCQQDLALAPLSPSVERPSHLLSPGLNGLDQLALSDASRLRLGQRVGGRGGLGGGGLAGEGSRSMIEARMAEPTSVWVERERERHLAEYAALGPSRPQTNPRLPSNVGMIHAGVMGLGDGSQGRGSQPGFGDRSWDAAALETNLANMRMARAAALVAYAASNAAPPAAAAGASTPRAAAGPSGAQMADEHERAMAASRAMLHRRLAQQQPQHSPHQSASVAPATQQASAAAVSAGLQLGPHARAVGVASSGSSTWAEPRPARIAGASPEGSASTAPQQPSFRSPHAIAVSSRTAFGRGVGSVRTSIASLRMPSRLAKYTQRFGSGLQRTTLRATQSQIPSPTRQDAMAQPPRLAERASAPASPVSRSRWIVR